jgi:predicted nuclease of predicted toxin-antitoxin system
MKLLLDENISYRVVKAINPIFPESMHVNKHSKVWIDKEIFEFAKANDFSIVTFDEDFYDIQLMEGYPPKIIWLRFGNSSNLQVTTKLLENAQGITSFLANPDLGILEIY